MMKNNILVLSKTTPVYVSLKDLKKFQDVFWSEKVYKFYIIQKLVVGNDIKFEIRSMRINEFCDILDKNKICWRLND